MTRQEWDEKKRSILFRFWDIYFHCFAKSQSIRILNNYKGGQSKISTIHVIFTLSPHFPAEAKIKRNPAIISHYCSVIQCQWKELKGQCLRVHTNFFGGEKSLHSSQMMSISLFVLCFVFPQALDSLGDSVIVSIWCVLFVMIWFWSEMKNNWKSCTLHKQSP